MSAAKTLRDIADSSDEEDDMIMMMLISSKKRRNNSYTHAISADLCGLSPPNNNVCVDNTSLDALFRNRHFQYFLPYIVQIINDIL